MELVAQAPGKLVVLGEYAVLEGVEAVVMAVDRRCKVSIEPSAAELCSVTTCLPDEKTVGFAYGKPSGVPLVDVVIDGMPCDPAPPAWSAKLDSSAFFHGATKLGLGSSAAALCAFAGAWGAYCEGFETPVGRPGIEALIGLHRKLQGGGSGLDVAAAACGGVITYRLGDDPMPHFGSVQLPKGVGFAGVFAGDSASTPGLVAKYQAWRRERPHESARQLEAMRTVSDCGCEAIRMRDATGFLAAVRDYGRQLSLLGKQLGREIVTPEHREITVLAERYGVAYKVSGAGGGDLGLAFSDDEAALEALHSAVRAAGFVWIDVKLAQYGLSIEERM